MIPIGRFIRQDKENGTSAFLASVVETFMSALGLEFSGSLLFIMLEIVGLLL